MLAVPIGSGPFHSATKGTRMARNNSTAAGRQRPTPALGKRLLFSAITLVLFFLACEGVLALLHVHPIVATQDPYLGFVSHLPLYVEEKQPDGSTLLVTAPNKRAYFNMQKFRKHKTRDTYRIFSLGESTTFGHPYDDRTSYSAWLRDMLPVVDPSRSWEVINAGGVSYASYRVAALMQELVHDAPDLFIVYVGQNEFLERRTYQGLIDANPTVPWLNAMASRSARSRCCAPPSPRAPEPRSPRALQVPDDRRGRCLARRLRRPEHLYA